MSTVAEAKLNIYNKLITFPTFNPSSASLFSDWTIQGGDIINVSSGENSYAVPVYGVKIQWNGSSKVDVVSTGKQNRGSLQKMAEKQSSRSGYSYRRGSISAQDQEYLRHDFYDEDGYFHSFVEATASYMMTAVESLESDVRSFIIQTPEMIHSEVGSAVSGFAQSVIEQTATYIRTEINNAASSITQSVIEQTTDYVRTEVSAVASGVAWSVITQTMTNIQQQIARKSKVYMQLTNPNDGVNEILNGDIWIKADLNKTWNDNNGNTWNSQSSAEWRSKYGDKHYVWDNGVWVPTLDTSRDVENEVTIEQTKDSLAIVGHAMEMGGKEYNSKLEVTARAIRSEASATSSNIYSTIEQTATSIRIEVSSAKSDLYSSIQQTASEITLSVSAAKSTLYSTIMQTATNIRSEVVGKNGVISSINQTAEEIKIQASKINLSGYVTTSQLSSIEGEINNLTSGNAVFTLIAANRASLGRSGTGTVSVYGHTLVTYKVIDVNGTERRLFGYTE